MHLKAAVMFDPARKAIVSSAYDCRDLCFLDVDASESDSYSAVSHSVIVLLRRASAQRLENQYLCSGMDLYLSAEPCAMCAMAIVHSRVRRVFYAMSDANYQCFSALRLHCNPKLNHHFDVYRNVFKAKVTRQIKDIRQGTDSDNVDVLK